MIETEDNKTPCAVDGSVAAAGASTMSAPFARQPTARGPRLGRPRAAIVAGMVVLAAGTVGLRAAEISVPNWSFESPATDFVTNNIDAWQLSPKPAWYDESGGHLWSQLVGLFQNTPAASADHIDNCDGRQAIYLFAVPQVALFQDFNSTDWAHSIPTHDFNARFEAGKSYQLTVGIIGGGGRIMEGVSIEVGLYYRDSASNMVTVVATNIAFTQARFPNTTHLVDVQVNTPIVQAGDAWAGQNVGLSLLSTVAPNLAGGYWDLDNVRLSGIRAPAWVGATRTNGQFSVTLESEPGLQFDILTSTNIAWPMSNWTSRGILTNTTGAVLFTETPTDNEPRFYRAQQMP